MDCINRREFLIAASAGLALAGMPNVFSGKTKPIQNKLPRWRGFNFLNFFSHRPYVADYKLLVATEQDFKWMADWGFDFVRIPLAYPTYLKYNPSLGKDITPEETIDFKEEPLEAVEELVYLANKYNLHVSLNLHRAPGFCINAGFREPFNLWKDQEAQDAFYVHWDMWAKRFRHVAPRLLSFDLVNEPCFKEDMNDQFAPAQAIPGDIYRKVAKSSLQVIHQQNADRLVVADGNNGGALVIPELMDLPIAQSCRGYFPHDVSHYRAGWVWKNPDDAPMPVWPAMINGKRYDREVLEDFYRPWMDLVKQGIGVHCGECGCFKETPHKVFLAWFEDQLDVLGSSGIGWGLWNFRGDFGLLDSGRKDVAYEDWYGCKLDSRLLKLLQKY
ncbi:glycoside hydrolase family 5 protein [Olivibacter sitiensis]|uniref:glycoside hydrolase family 5 protein n=1 Tax=Olivibacter sitiensis TaxID=376470 RepID=UPI0003FD89A5|nr:cellulase family glycosylhydrolase [Olivibacter sitiensis]